MKIKIPDWCSTTLTDRYPGATGSLRLHLSSPSFRGWSGACSGIHRHPWLHIWGSGGRCSGMRTAQIPGLNLVALNCVARLWTSGWWHFRSRVGHIKSRLWGRARNFRSGWSRSGEFGGRSGVLGARRRSIGWQSGINVGGKGGFWCGCILLRWPHKFMTYEKETRKKKRESARKRTRERTSFQWGNVDKEENWMIRIF